MSENNQNKSGNKSLQKHPLLKKVEQFFTFNQTEFPNRLAHPYCRDDEPRHENWILLFLFAFALIPRLVMFSISNGASDDSYYYIHIAKTLGEGDFSYRGAFYYLGLNIYPMILLGLHKLGLGWLQGGMAWGAIISSLTVLPIYGWVKRLFDYRVALVASFLFAIHPDLIEYSIDPIREPTSWFLVSLFLYFAVRAIVETHIWLFIGLGITFCLAIQTRSECWLLIFPIGAWYVTQFLSNRVSRKQLTIGMIVMLSITPILLLIVNLTFLKNEEKWQLGRLHHFKEMSAYLMPEEESPKVIPTNAKPAIPKKPVIASTIKPEQSSITLASLQKKAVVPPIPVNHNPEFSGKPVNGSMKALYLNTLIRTHEPILSILHLIGVLVFFRQLYQIDKLPLFVYYILLLVSVWLRTNYSHNINGRYFHNLFFVTVPFQALGFMVLCRAAGNFNKFKANLAVPSFRSVPAFGLILFLTIIYWTDAFTSHHIKRTEEVQFGKWLHENIEGVNTVLVDHGSSRIGYYAQGGAPEANYHHVLLSDLIKKSPPDLVILSRLKVSKYFKRNTTKLVKPLGLEPIESGIPSSLAKDYLILAKKPIRSTLHIAKEPDSSSVH
jgi:Dolichyl-phosphate-mannose-protein mannosyltransferase